MTTQTHYSVTAVKTFRGREGHGLNATLHCDGRKVALVMDDASGALDSRFEWLAKDAATRAADAAALAAHILTLPPVDCSDIEAGMTMEMTPSLFVDQLAGEWEMDKVQRSHLRKLLKCSTIISVDGKLRQLAGQPSPSFLAAVANAYDGAVVLNSIKFDEALALFVVRA